MFEASKSQLKEMKQYQIEKTQLSTPSSHERFSSGPKWSTAAADRAALALVQHKSFSIGRQGSSPALRDHARKTLFGGGSERVFSSEQPGDPVFLPFVTRSRSAPRAMLTSPVDGRQYAPPADYLPADDAAGDEMLIGSRIISQDDLVDIEVGGLPAPAPAPAPRPVAEVLAVLDLQEVESFLAEESQVIDSLSNALHHLDAFVEVRGGLGARGVLEGILRQSATPDPIPKAATSPAPLLGHPCDAMLLARHPGRPTAES